MSPLISTAELAERLASDPSRTGGRRLVVLDATTTLPGEQFDPRLAFEAAHVPGARYFDIDAFSDPDSALPHMVPSQGRFARLIGALGIDRETDIVFYDQTGVVSAARGWWLAGLFGHDRARVLDGGLPAWREENRPVGQGAPEPAEPAIFIPALRAARLIGLGDMASISRDLASSPAGMATHILDARSRGRFDGIAPEPRAGLPGGHIPGASSLPFGELLADGRHFLQADRLRAVFAAAGVREGDAVITSCGSGLTASVLSLGLAICGWPPGAMYDGSWTEWAQSDLPREASTL